MMDSSYSWQICPSKWLIRLLMVGYVLALIACFLNALGLAIKLSLAIIIFLHSVLTLKRLVRENWRLDYDDKNGWQLIEASTLHSIEILSSTVISRSFIFLHYRSGGKKFYRLICKDALVPNINDYRQLLVTLKTYQ